ncbi:EAL domain-containing protein [bacterium]|nr:EAL domain-containing protein [bacterium]
MSALNESNRGDGAAFPPKPPPEPPPSAAQRSGGPAAERFRAFAFAAADLHLTTDAYGRILDAEGDATLMHHPSADRLIGKNALELVGEASASRFREDLWTLGPGRRLSWEDPGSIEGGRRILAQRSLPQPDRFLFCVSRMPATIQIRGDRIEELLGDRFRDAVMNGRLMAARQPIIDLSNGRISHYEMLARFDGEDSPASLIGAAEKTGQICHLDYIMVRAAAAMLEHRRDPSYRLAVNISGESVQRADVVTELRAAIAGHEFARDRLILEVTESSEIMDIDAAAHCVSMLRGAGVGVSLDDFGAGAASFTYLRALEVDGLKFDGGFLRSDASSPRSVALMRSVAQMCLELDITSVGERVETETDRHVLINAGVRFGQGYLFGRPEIDEEFFQSSRSNYNAAAA